MSDRVAKLLNELTLEEKVGLVSGRDFWTNHPVERLGIHALKVSDGPNGARGRHFELFNTSACFPCGTALAATWNPELVEEVGAALGVETRSKGARQLLAPTINIHRSPLAGRNFECYSEDPHLSGRMAVAFVTGVQSEGVGATLKHFACNDSEFERHTISTELGERALREIYLVPFEAAVKEADPWCVMAAYNKVEGVYCAEHERLNEEILRGEWGFEGYLISDWFGAQSTVASANQGLDLEMPGPVRHFGAKLVEAVNRGEVGTEKLDTMVSRVLRIHEMAGLLDAEVPDIEESNDLPAHRALARRAGSESMVLLRNEESLLPIDSAAVGRVAVIGPNAGIAINQGGGSARVAGHRTVSPLAGIRKHLGSAAEVIYERGCSAHRGSIPPLDVSWIEGGADFATPELTTEIFATPDLSGECVATESRRWADAAWLQDVAPGVPHTCFSARMSGRFIAPETGAYRFSLASNGKSRLRIAGEVVLDHWTDPKPGGGFHGAGTAKIETSFEMQAGTSYEVEIEFGYEGDAGLVGFTCGCLLPEPPDLMERAVAAAASADVVIAVVGLNSDWETEGRDREDMELPGRQRELIEKVCAANPRTAVIINAGSPISMEWEEAPQSILQIWYPGQEMGHSLADILFGAVSPSGRLPTTIPMRYRDNPAYLNYPGENGEVHYGEGIFVGYRYYDAKRIAPRFAFGHGLSYSQFEYGPLQLVAQSGEATEGVRFGLEIRNTGARAAAEVVQVYLRDEESSLIRPEQELRAFAKVELEAGESKQVDFELDARALSFYDPGAGDWVAEAGKFEIRVGASSRDIRSRAHFELRDPKP